MYLAVDHQMDDDDQRVEGTSTDHDQHEAGGVSDHLVNYQAADVSMEAELGLFFPTDQSSHDDVDFPNMEKDFDDQHSFYLGAACSSLIIREADACLQQIDHHHPDLINIEKDDVDDHHHDQYSFDNINSFQQCQKIRNSSAVMIFRRSCDQSAARLQSRSDRDAGRSCAVCHTTKTPLWRGGPKGPKSLCNACGIRQRKARRAALMAAAAAAASGDRLEAVSLSDDHSTTNIIINNAGMITKKKVGRKSHDHHHGHEFDHEDMNMNSSSAAAQLDKMLMVRRPRNKLLHIQKRKKKTTKETSSSAGAGNNLIQLTNYSDDQLLFESRSITGGRINYTANPKDLLHQAGFDDQKGTAGTGQLVINFSSSTSTSRRRSAFNRVFPKDEEEGAVLLMALSCGGGGRDYS